MLSLVVADATQACGWLPVDATAFDALVAHAYKWLMSPRGSSCLYVGAGLRERMQPRSAGWYAGADRARPDRTSVFRPSRPKPCRSSG